MIPAIKALSAVGIVLALTPVVEAGMRPQVDLSLEVTTTPVPFVPGGHGTVTMTVHNAGPDSAGATLPGQQTIVVDEKAFIITDEPPPFEIRGPVIGCTPDVLVTEPLPDGNIALIFLFYFDAISPGASRTCTYNIEFYPSTRSNFSTWWRVSSPNDMDNNPANDRIDYVFEAPSVSIPTTSWKGLLSLGIGLIAMVWIMRGRTSMPRAAASLT